MQHKEWDIRLHAPDPEVSGTYKLTIISEKGKEYKYTGVYSNLRYVLRLLEQGRNREVLDMLSGTFVPANITELSPEQRKSNLKQVEKIKDFIKNECNQPC